MATFEEYVYSKATDFNGNEHLEQLQVTIAADAGIVTPVVQHLGTVGDVMTVYFDVALSAGEETILDGLVSGHTDTVIYSSDLQEVSGETSVSVTSKNFIPVSGMVMYTLMESSKYRVNFDCDLSSDHSKVNIEIAVYIDEVEVSGSKRKIRTHKPANIVDQVHMATQHLTGVLAKGTKIDLCWKVNKNTGVMHNRSLIIQNVK